jgi:hypothetical protein
MVLDVLFMKDLDHSGYVSKHTFKEFLQHDLNLKTVSGQDLDLLFRTHPVLATRAALTRADLQNTFLKLF